MDPRAAPSPLRPFAAPGCGLGDERKDNDVSRAASPPIGAETAMRTVFEKSMSEDDCCSSCGDVSSSGDLVSPRTRTQRERLGAAPVPRAERIKTLLESMASARRKASGPPSRGSSSSAHDPPANPMQ